MERTDTITLGQGGKSLTPSAEFQRLVKKKTLTKSAELKSYETVVFTVPASGKAASSAPTRCCSRPRAPERPTDVGRITP